MKTLEERHCFGGENAALVARLRRQRRQQARARGLRLGALGIATLALFVLALHMGQNWNTPAQVIAVLQREISGGQPLPGLSFTIGQLRLPRAVAALLCGAAFGLAGVAMQTLLRNPLASPDIVGISAGASAGAVVAIIILGWGENAVALAAFGGAILTAATIYLLAHKQAFSATRLVLIGIGLAAMLKSLITYALSRASNWDLQAAMRWINGSLSAASWANILPVALGFMVLLPLLVSQGRGLDTLRLGDDLAAGLGMRPGRVRLMALGVSVALLALATASCGPVAFVAFMAGPIASRIMPAGAPLLAASALVGAVMVAGADLVAQFAFATRYPVGVVTGMLGAPYLIYLLVRVNRAGGGL